VSRRHFNIVKWFAGPRRGASHVHWSRHHMVFPPFMPGRHGSFQQCLSRYLQSQPLANDLEELQGHVLACECPAGQPCHTDFLATKHSGALAPMSCICSSQHRLRECGCSSEAALAAVGRCCCLWTIGCVRLNDSLREICTVLRAPRRSHGSCVRIFGLVSGSSAAVDGFEPGSQNGDFAWDIRQI
jgi:hypothetical protein